MSDINGRAFLRAVTAIAMGSAGGQAVVALGTVVLTRQYSPQELGLFSVYVSLLSVVSVISAWRFEQAIPLPESDHEALRLTILSLVAVCITSVVVLIVALVYAYVNPTSKVADIHYIALLPIGVVLAGAYQSLSYWAIRKRQFNLIAKTRFSQGPVTIAVQILAGMVGFGVLGLLGGHVLGQSAGISILISRFRKEARKFSFALSDIRRVAREYRRFPLMSSPSALLSSLALQAPVFVLALKFDAAAVGYLALSQRIIGMPMSLLGGAIGQVYLQQAASVFRSDPEQIIRMIVEITRKLALIGIVPMTVLMIGGPDLAGLILGESWRTAGVYMQALAPAFFFQFCIAPVAQTLNVIGRQDLHLTWEITRFGATVGAIWFCAASGYSPIMAVAAYSAMYAMALLILYVITLRACRAAIVGQRERNA